MIGSIVAAGRLPQTDPHQAAGIGQAEGRATLALLWPRAVRARQRRPGFLRRLKINSGIPGQSRWPVAYLLDVILNRDLWMHRVDLSRATGRPLVSGGHDQQIVAQVVRDLALGWSAAPVALELTGPAGGFWLLGSGDPVAVVRADAVAYLRALSGRDDDVVLELISGNATALTPIRQARVAF